MHRAGGYRAAPLYAVRSPGAESSFDDCPKDGTCPIEKFTDIDQTGWYHDGIHFCIDEGIMKGISENVFDPDGNITRAMIVTMLWRLDGSPVVTSKRSFKDVTSNDWFRDPVAWAAEHGIVNGISATEFAPNVSITREELATMMYRYARYKGIDTDSNTGTAGTTVFKDLADVSNWAGTALQWTIRSGLINGMTSTTVVPRGTATRAQAATIFMRLCSNVMPRAMDETK